MYYNLMDTEITPHSAYIAITLKNDLLFPSFCAIPWK